MGILGFVGKVAGTAVLTATGVASAVFERAAEMTGNETVAELATSGKEASFGTIKSMWGGSESDALGTLNEEDAAQRELRNRIQRYNGEISQLKTMASAAKQAGNDEQYNYYTERAAALREEVDALKSEY